MDLTTQYLGMTLPHPILASASPLSRTAEGVRKLEDSGAAAVILPSLFAEQVKAENATDQQVPSWRPQATADMLVPGWSQDPLGTREYLDLISLSRRFTSVPVIASLNADGPGDWARYARSLADAGANALELNLYYVAADVTMTAAMVEGLYIEAVQAVRAETSLPLSVKIGPYFSALPHFARRLRQAGADALVLFNRYYEPDFDLETRSTAKRDVVFSQSRHDLRLPLRWTAILSALLEGDAPQIALTGGVHTGTDVVKALMAGATVVEVASELIANGESRLMGLRAELAAWLQAHQYDSSDAIRGIMRTRRGYASLAEAERAGYIDTVRSYPK